VAARSYALNLRGRHAAEGYDLCATTHCQRLDPDAVTPRLASLAAQTAGELSASAVPAQPSGPVLPAAARRRVALERTGGGDRGGAAPVPAAHAGGDPRHLDRAAHGLGAGADA